MRQRTRTCDAFDEMPGQYSNPIADRREIHPLIPLE
jgi:hypothetical protein